MCVVLFPFSKLLNQICYLAEYTDNGMKAFGSFVGAKTIYNGLETTNLWKKMYFVRDFIHKVWLQNRQKLDIKMHISIYPWSAISQVKAVCVSQLLHLFKVSPFIDNDKGRQTGVFVTPCRHMALNSTSRGYFGAIH